MPFEEENRVNQAAYKRLRGEIDLNYPKGRFIGFADGKVVADAESFEAIDTKLNELGFEPLKTMVVVAGDDMPEYVDILSPLFMSGPR